MQIIVNHQTQEVTGNTTLLSVVLAHAGDKLNGIAAAVNQQVISKTNWDSHLLQPNDSIIIIKATQGG